MTVASAFQDKTIWITGASSGFGEALARAFDQAGAKLILSARRKDRLQALAAELKNAKIVPLDLTKSECFEADTAEAIDAFGTIDILVHDAAIGQKGSILETSPAVARHIMDVDYFSYTELTRFVLPHMMARKSGHIVVVSGLIIAAPAPGRSSYIAAKAALLGYFDCLRAEMLPYQIKVTNLVPGEMKTDFIAGALQADGKPVGGAGNENGCPVDEVARQSLEAIADGTYLAYVGNEAGRQVWQSYRQDPNQMTALFLERVQQQMAQK